MHRIEKAESGGYPGLELVSPQGLAATFVPGAGMLCASLRDGDAELLGQRHGVRDYAQKGKTMGIPLLYPWANRLARYGYRAGDTEVAIPRDASVVADDGSGLPIHGIVPGCLEWKVRDRSADEREARLVAELDAEALPDVKALFPFPHRLRVEAALRGRALEITTTLAATGDRRVPVAFGYHPYFRLPDVPRAEWQITLPVRGHMRLDEQLLPTGHVDPVAIEPAPLGDRTYDDLFTEIDPEPVFALAGGGRRIEVAFGPAYRVAVIFAPASDDVVCFEPMTAPTNPFEGQAPLVWVEPGSEYAASFSVRVVRDPAGA